MNTTHARTHVSIHQHPPHTLPFHTNTSTHTLNTNSLFLSLPLSNLSNYLPVLFTCKLHPSTWGELIFPFLVHQFKTSLSFLQSAASALPHLTRHLGTYFERFTHHRRFCSFRPSHTHLTDKSFFQRPILPFFLHSPALGVFGFPSLPFVLRVRIPEEREKALQDISVVLNRIKRVSLNILLSRGGWDEVLGMNRREREKCAYPVIFPAEQTITHWLNADAEKGNKMREDVCWVLLRWW